MNINNGLSEEEVLESREKNGSNIIINNVIEDKKMK